MRRILFLLPFLLLPCSTWAQEDPNRPALPDIAPREVEIRGQIEISFPSLTRQPLVGFNPPPRVQPIPASRRPFIESYRLAKAPLPPSSLAPPQPPAVSPLARQAPRMGELEASAGRYLTRRLRLRAEQRLPAGSALYGRFDYRGTDGSQPFDFAPELTNPSDDLAGRAGLRFSGSHVGVTAEAGGFYSGYTLYGAQLPAGPNYVDVPDRIGRGAEGGLRFETEGGLPVEASGWLGYATTRYETDVLGDQGDAPADFVRIERRLTADAHIDVPAGAGTASADLRLSRATFDENDLVQDPIYLVNAGGAFRFSYARTIDLTFGARFFRYARPDPAAGEVRAAGYVAPLLRLDLYPAQGVRLYLKNQPTAEANGLLDLYRENPYLVDEPLQQATVTTIDAESGIRFFAGPVEVTARAGYRKAPSYRFFEQATTDEAGGYSLGFSTVGYAEARVLHAGGDVSVVLPGGLQATVGASYRQGRLTEDDTLIPNFAPVVGRAMISFAFDDRRGLVQLTGAYESARFRDRDKTRRLGDYLDLDLEGSYNLTRNLGLIGRLENMSSGYLERWDHYPGSPFVLMAGVRLLW